MSHTSDALPHDDQDEDQEERSSSASPDAATPYDAEALEAEEGASAQTIPPSRLSRLASGALHAVASAGAATDPMQQTTLKSRLRKFVVPIGVLLFLLLLFTLFREILLPFILALVIVYLMEPVVSRIGKTESDPRGLPRWLAVILVYAVFFGVVTTSVVLIIPQFVSEIVRFGETVPEEITRFRTERLPELNSDFRSALKDYLPAAAQTDPEAAERRGALKRDGALEAASTSLHGARGEGAAVAAAFGEARRLVSLSRRATIAWEVRGDPGFEERVYVASYPPRVQLELEQVWLTPSSGTWRYASDGERPSIRLVPSAAGGFDLFLNDVALDVERRDHGSWRVRRASGAEDVRVLQLLAMPEEAYDEEDHGTLYSMLDLEKGLNDLVEEVVTSSNARLASLITYAQQLVLGIIQAFVALILTLMVAAFITIDLHAVKHFFRNLIPAEHRTSYDGLLVDMDRGLSGVVRGQLMICLINGVLTYIGLMLLDIKFSLLLAVVAGILSLIPIFGTILSTIPIVLFGLTDGLTTGFLALLWILGIHFVEANILNPKIIGTSAHIHPVIVIFALLAGESAFGLVGALLAVPTASIMLTLFRFFVMRTPAGQQAIRQVDQEVLATGPRIQER